MALFVYVDNSNVSMRSQEGFGRICSRSDGTQDHRPLLDL